MKGRRDEGTKGRRDEGTKGRREEGKMRLLVFLLRPITDCTPCTDALFVAVVGRRGDKAEKKPADTLQTNPQTFCF